MRRRSVIELSNSTGSPATAGDTTITPLARSVMVRWRGGGAVWSGPAAIIVERNGRTERIPIVNVNRRILWGLRLGAAVALIAIWIAHDRRRKDSND